MLAATINIINIKVTKRLSEKKSNHESIKLKNTLDQQTPASSLKIKIKMSWPPLMSFQDKNKYDDSN